MDTVIFDIGNVLMGFDWWPFVNGLIGEEDARIVSDAIWNHGVWNELDRGIMSIEDILAGFISYAPEHEDAIRKTFAAVGSACHKADYAIPWLREVKALGYRVLFLSNYSHYLMDAAPHALDFLPETEGGIFSCDVHLCKPDEAIYRTITERYALNPGKCLFIDDNADNIAAARAFGLNAYLFTNYETDHDKIMALLAKS